MTHALLLPTLDADDDRVPVHADPVFAAIDRHNEALAVFAAAPQGRARARARDNLHKALADLLGTPCATRTGMLSLIRHFRRWETEETSPDAGGPEFGIAMARAADLSICLGVPPIQRHPVVLPSGRLIAPARPVATRVGRALARGAETLAALVIIAGGAGLVGIATLL
ncbi:hypothetical protein [Methylorubrum extorquens]|uniref:Uncharacterized protein n=1 Tax=Methylorubrum extorquens (strain ATCC 14718 / DSM 1338 / JCM 2805 / NCIMB 9133 / AM1) TaxID=272630 RepID=C5B6W4_METEA|nr:hypothetical protein [Methylorubrum extorquens]ACS44196.1 Hypothetical protein MexAM1_p3METAp0022 [Methylorubrum extorquens AM1]MCP1591985.1 hypothetical protein [Methylorubrum extorquens]